MKFIDLFAGLGGFHHGLNNAGDFECVFASELNDDLRKLYQENYKLDVSGDITKVDENSIPAHDVLCAGFPCQPFSLAGSKKGAKCPESGKLIDDVLRVAKKHRPQYLMLENVPNVLTIADGEFWNYINIEFAKLGYKLIHKIISPTDIGIPQNRKRLFIIGFLDHKDADTFIWPTIEKSKPLNSILNSKYPHKKIETKKYRQLGRWQNLLNNCELPNPLPSLSFVAQDFGANYPLDFSKITIKEMQKYKGAYGQSLGMCKNWEQLLEKLPSYCKKSRTVPNWLIQSVVYSRNIYSKNKGYIDLWLKDLDKDNNSWQILEWRGLKKDLDFKYHLLQFRASGIRVSKNSRAPSLISMTPTQIPIIGSEMRYMSKYEAAKLQNLQNLSRIPDNEVKAFKAFGNAVNAKIVELIASNIKRLKK